MHKTNSIKGFLGGLTPMKEDNMSKIQAQAELKREKKERIPVWMYPSTLAMIEGALQQANCKSRSEFLEEAAKYYAGYVSAENAIQYLPPMLVSAFRGTVRDSEMHISRLLFKLAVELDMMMNILASELDTEPEVLAQMRGRCIQNVKKTGGYIAFENAARYQLKLCEDEANPDE